MVTIPLWLNSQSTLLYDYMAYLIDATRFRVEIRDPYTGNCACPECCREVPIQDWFSADAGAMVAGNQPGHVTIAMQKSVAADVNANFFGSLSTTTRDSAAVALSTLEVGHKS